MLGGSLGSPRGRARATPLPSVPARSLACGSDTVLAGIWRLSIEGTRLFNSISESSLSHEPGAVRGKHGWPRFTARHSGMSTANTRLRTLGNVLPTSSPHPRAFELRRAPRRSSRHRLAFRARVRQNLVHLCEWRCLR